jgi:hypothetical protein
MITAVDHGWMDGSTRWRGATFCISTAGRTTSVHGSRQWFVSNTVFIMMNNRPRNQTPDEKARALQTSKTIFGE